MPRYIKQRNNYSCGPVALLNALKWSGAKCTYRRSLYGLMLQCGTMKRTGTPFIHLARAARTFPGFFSARTRRNVTLAEIDAHLKGGGVVILGSVSMILDPDNYHYFLILGKVGQRGETSYRTVNFDRRATQRLVSAKLIREGMRKAAAMDTSREGRPYALFLRKR